MASPEQRSEAAERRFAWHVSGSRLKKEKVIVAAVRLQYDTIGTKKRSYSFGNVLQRRHCLTYFEHLLKKRRNLVSFMQNR